VNAPNQLRVSKLYKQGNSTGIIIPVEFLRSLGLTSGQLIRLDMVDDEIILRRLNEQATPHRRAPRKNGPGEFIRGHKSVL
jgi:antitoxin component of MazEF toxin-antitoxin module